MKIKKNYTFTNNRQIWRLLPTDTGKLIIEDREIGNKEVFFSCIDEKTGKIIFRNVQLEEKFWIGIEAIGNDIIIFHKFRKPDLPGHKELIAFDIRTRTVLWTSDEFSYLQIYENTLYVYKQKFEGRNYYKLNLLTGEMEDDLGNDTAALTFLNKISNEDEYKNYYFPNRYSGSDDKPGFSQLVNSITGNSEITGNIEYINFNEMLLMNFYEKNRNGNFTNKFFCVEIKTGKTIFSEILNSDAKAFVPDSFYVKDENLFLLKNKNTLIVYKLLW